MILENMRVKGSFVFFFFPKIECRMEKLKPCFFILRYLGGQVGLCGLDVNRPTFDPFLHSNSPVVIRVGQVGRA